MGLLDLPNEILTAITEALEYGWDLNAFCLVNRRIHEIVNIYLYQHKLPTCAKEALLWNLKYNNEDAVAKCLDAEPQAYTDKGFIQTALWEAIHAGQHRTIQRLVEIGIPQFYKPKGHGCSIDMESPLSVAVSTGYIPVVHVLLSDGADKFDFGDDSMLAIAAAKGDIEMMKYLVEMGFDPNEQGRRGGTPLSAAAWQGHSLAAEFLLRRGANPNPQIKNGKSPIKLAAFKGHIEIVQLLIAHGANVNPTSEQKPELPIFDAVKMFQMKTATLILEHMDLDQFITEHDDRALLLPIAAASGRGKLVSRLIQKGHHPDEKPPQGIPQLRPLEWAAMQGHETVVNFLLENGADAPDYHTLFLAVDNGHLHIVRILLERDPGYFLRGRSPNNHLLFPAIQHTDIFQLLLEHGADPDVHQTSFPSGCIHPPYVIEKVLESGSVVLLQMLWDRGVVPQLLRSVQGKWTSILASAARGGSPMLESLFQHGLAVAPHIECRQPALYDTIQRKDFMATRFLLSKGFTFPQDDYLPKSIDIAADSTDIDHNETLLDLVLLSGVDINARDYLKHTCLWHAIHSTTRLDLLLVKGANPLLQDIHGDTPLTHVAGTGNNQAVEIILKRIEVNWAQFPRDEIYKEVSAAESTAVTHKLWRIVQALRRFRQLHFDV